MGGEFEGDEESSSHVFPAAAKASYVSMECGSSHTTDVLGRKDWVRLVFATREENNYGGTNTSTLKLWASVSTQGGREVWLLKSLIKDAPQNEVALRRGINLKITILELDSGR